ncbi:MAG: GNAT family N-acetyltransferase [Clostridiales bacterium]|nr:GNAT family N-acetyltransferase [Clostridiales bacterium]
MLETRLIGRDEFGDINLPNQPFTLFGKLLPSYAGGQWTYEISLSDSTEEMCFPDENYDFDRMSPACAFIGAYEGGACVGLAVMQNAPFGYMYLYDLKVNREYRGKGAAQLLIEKAKSVASRRGYKGIYTIGQDNNLGACLFYLKSGFRIGGLDTEVYKGTNQEGKKDIYFYLDI